MGTERGSKRLCCIGTSGISGVLEDTVRGTGRMVSFSKFLIGRALSSPSLRLLYIPIYLIVLSKISQYLSVYSKISQYLSG